jgi:hypothetical protein
VESSEVASHTVTKVSALADIEDVAWGISEKINARFSGQSIKLFFKASVLHSKPYPRMKVRMMRMMTIAPARMPILRISAITYR